VRPETLVTDAGSTKAAIVRKAQGSFRHGTFLGGHPMAGKERSGVEWADPELFRNRPYVLTPLDAASDTSEFRRWLLKIGAHIVEMSPAEHDSVVAFTSHLPQLVSTALAATVAARDSDRVSQVFGSALTDMTRLALSSPDLWLSILTTNKAEVTFAVNAFISVLSDIRDALDTDALRNFFDIGGSFASTIRNLDGRN
jgi:prephenate dehydrogenase